LRLLRAATLRSADINTSARRYQEFLGYRLVESGAISPALAASWGTPGMSGRPYHVLAPASGAPVYLRFVEGCIPADYQPLRTYGWGAIELCVQDVQATHARLQDSPFTIIGPPKALDGAPSIWPMQVQGPDGEIVFLTEIRADSPQARLPRAASPVDCLFIAVLACQDIAAARAWFTTNLGLSGAPDFELAYTTLSRAFGLPMAHKHRIAVLGHDGDAFLQLDQYPQEATTRPTAAGELPPGVAMISFLIPAAESSNAPEIPGIINAGGSSRVIRTPQGAFAELIAAPGRCESSKAYTS
jgi:catechol 2,3-dioxygenase-like lactoylglutathione lyase family enzyme